MRYIQSALAAAIGMFAAPTNAQSPAAAGPFDGKWIGKELICSPTLSSASFSYVTIINSKFRFRWNNLTCDVQVNPDGQFSNDKCEVPLAGQISGNRLTFRFTTNFRFCKAEALLEKK